MRTFGMHVLISVFIGAISTCRITSKKRKKPFNHKHILWISWRKIVIVYNFLSVKKFKNWTVRFLVFYNLDDLRVEAVTENKICNFQLRAWAVLCACVLLAYRVPLIRYSKYWRYLKWWWWVNILSTVGKLVQSSLTISWKIFPRLPSFEDSLPSPQKPHSQVPATHNLRKLMLWKIVQEIIEESSKIQRKLTTCKLQ